MAIQWTLTRMTIVFGPVFGHLIAAVVGVTVNVIFMALPDYNTIRWLACPFAVSITIFFMQLTNTLHPPAGATALIAVCNSAVFRLGYIYVAYILIAISILLLVALLLNNILRRYPLWWLRPKTRPNGDMDLELGRGEDHVVCQCQTCKEARRYSQRSRQPSIAEFAGSDARYTGEKPRTSSQFTEKYPVPPSPRVSVYSSRSFDTEYPDERMLDHALEVEEVPLDAMRHSLEQLDGEGVHVVEINRPEPSYAPESSLHR
ncbi:HPP family-domain-containing protein [Jimgerdemannia flammicorona]|uniref:HPP family-domain-containing protein n=2 Tax=Jimgerdemannia flammicorona TaxID=994334 RepID=A0A433QLH7_9FUNG|nr:HPP family-domain-containing protein [Jimgerdemannia flammicorona]RUS30615.1 HPP family-domain-containing protein [Jimgerdemannia flammicorona]